jgi:8-oxo-dGTP pyrophosphatase MutT (NUDIX family)
MSTQVSGIVLVTSDRTRVLAVKSLETEIWSFPKGYANPGESAKDTAIRKAREEAAIIVPFVALTTRLKMDAAYYLLETEAEKWPILPTTQWIEISRIPEMRCNSAMRCFHRNKWIGLDCPDI